MTTPTGSSVTSIETILVDDVDALEDSFSPSPSDEERRKHNLTRTDARTSAPVPPLDFRSASLAGRTESVSSAGTIDVDMMDEEIEGFALPCDSADHSVKSTLRGSTQQWEGGRAGAEGGRTGASASPAGALNSSFNSGIGLSAARKEVVPLDRNKPSSWAHASANTTALAVHSQGRDGGGGSDRRGKEGRLRGGGSEGRGTEKRKGARGSEGRGQDGQVGQQSHVATGARAGHQRSPRTPRGTRTHLPMQSDVVLCESKAARMKQKTSAFKSPRSKSNAPNSPTKQASAVLLSSPGPVLVVPQI